MSFTGGRLKLKGDDGGVKKKKKKKSKAGDESKALQLVEESTAKESVVKVNPSVRKAPSHPPYYDSQPTAWSLRANTAVHSLLHTSFYTGSLYSMSLACLPLKQMLEGTRLVLLTEVPFSIGVSETAECCIAGDKGRVHS